MANQPLGRPWFRLASLRPVAPPPPAPAPAPAPAQESRFSLIQPTNRNNSSPERRSVTSSPAQKLPAQSSSSLPTSPLQNGSISSSVSSSFSPNQKPSPPSSSASSPAKAHISPSTKQKIQTIMQSQNAKPTTSPPSASSTQKSTTPQSASSTTKQVFQTLIQSPKAKHKSTTPPPSPLTLPPSQLKSNSEINPKIPEEAESKSVISLHKRIENPKHLTNDNNSGETLNLQNHNEKKQYGNNRKTWGSEESPMKVITIAGENRGAYMELIHSPNKNGFRDKPNYVYGNGVSKIKSENGESGNSSSDEGNGKKKEKKNNTRAKSSNPMSAFMNSNVQCVNNSILYNASCSHNDPGLCLSLTRKPFESEGFHFKEMN